MSESSLHYLELCPNPIRFDAANQLTDVFFDDCNKQVFSVRSNGATGIVVKGPTTDSVISFCINDRGSINSIKFSPDNKILAIQRGTNTVEFLSFGGEPQIQELLTHQCKVLVFGLVWIHNCECVVFSKDGIETLSISTEKRQIRSVKNVYMDIKWFTWCSAANIAVVGSGEDNVLTPVLIKHKTTTKLPKLICDANYQIHEKKITISKIYGSPTVLVLHSSSSAVEIVIYLLIGPGLAPQKCHVLRLDHPGRFAINIVDNVIVVHHQTLSKSFLFDIGLPGEVINGVTYHKAITTAMSIKPFELKMPSISPIQETYQCKLYSSHWVVFQPNIVIDAKLGCMWHLNLSIAPLCDLISDKMHLTEFLLLRENGKNALIEMLESFFTETVPLDQLLILEDIFNKINNVYALHIQFEMDTQTGQSASHAKSTVRPPLRQKTVLDQVTMLRSVFEPFSQRPYIESVLLLYLQSLHKYNITAQEELSKFIINKLIANRSFATLERLISHSLLMESKSIACLLLSHSGISKNLTQIALDILKKKQANEIIFEVSLGHKRVVDALQLSKHCGEGNVPPIRKFLEATQHCRTDMIAYSVFQYFKLRNISNWEALRT